MITMYKMVTRLKLFGDNLYCSTARGRYIQQRPTSLLCYFQDDMTDIFKSHWNFWTAERCQLNILVFAKFHLLTNNNCLKMHVEIKARNICSSSRDLFFSHLFRVIFFIEYMGLSYKIILPVSLFYSMTLKKFYMQLKIYYQQIFAPCQYLLPTPSWLLVN